jgi:O-antigen/teichoic acid export membrane protein
VTEHRELTREERGVSIASGAAAAMAGQLTVYAIGFVVSVIIARALGPAGRGEYYLPVTAAAVCLAVVNMGVESANVVMLAERRFSLAQLARNAGALALIIGPIAALATFGVYEGTRSSVFEGVRSQDLLIVAATIPVTLHQLWLVNVFVLAKRIAWTQVAFVAGALVQLTGALVLFAIGKLGVTEVLLLWAASFAVPWGVLLAWSADVAPLRPAIDLRVMREVLRFGLRFHGGLLLMFLLLRLDVFLVGAYGSRADVGLYSLAVMFAELTWLLTNPLAMAVMPFQAEQPMLESAPLAFKAARFNFMLAAGLCVLFAATLWFAVPILFGDAFGAAYPAIVVLLPGVLLMAAARPLTVIVSRQERPLLYTGLAGIAFLVNLVLNVVLIPAIGIVGASIASTVGYGLISAALTVWALRAGGMGAREALVPQADDLRSLRAVIGRLRRAARGAG